MEYNFWDDRTYEVEINPCRGCGDYSDSEGCISHGGCGYTPKITDKVRERCGDCFFLVCSSGEWVCDELQKKCNEVEVCPESQKGE